MLATLYIFYSIPKCMGSLFYTTVKANVLSSVMTVCRNGFHNGVMAWMLKIGERNIHRVFVVKEVFTKAIFSYLKLKPDDGFLP